MNIQTSVNSCIEQKDNRLHYIDLIEVLGTLFVLIYHSTTYNFSFLNENKALLYIRYFLQTILSTCVPLFFFANGYLLLNKTLNLKKHILKSIKMVILTFLWGMIVTAALMPIKGTYLSPGTFIEYVWTFKQGWINYLWYMGALISIYVFFPLIKKAYDSDKNVFIYFTIIVAIFTFGNKFIDCAVSLFLSCLGRLEFQISYNWFNMFNPFFSIYGYAFTYFCLGGIAHMYKDRILAMAQMKRNLIAIGAIISSCVVLFGLGIVFSKSSGEIWDVVWSGYDTLPTVINVLAIFVLALSYKGNSKFLRCISSNSLGI